MLEVVRRHARSDARVAPRGDAAAGHPRSSNLLMGGGYAWAVTVAYPAVALGTAWPAWTAAALALLALLVGVGFGRLEPRWFVPCAVYAFPALSAFAWFLLGSVLDSDRISPALAASGGLGWGLYALSFGDVRAGSGAPEDAPNVVVQPPLAPRARSPLAATLCFGVGLCGGLALWALGWLLPVADTQVLLLRVCALGLGTVLMGAGAQLAVALAHRSPTRRRQSSPMASLGSALAVAVLGLLLWLTRGQF